ncbi:MAG TPA: chromosome segregation protein SMC [Rudaea sp.]|nr:chromosome segregation protein SMC [Rudaea sp.]
MRLTTIKLSGFKSFVDPTVMQLPTNMTGVVGPNGCGKSNIIDAIRWVMGESAASRLRGDALSDVIFSGSTGRKPVGTATVELVFDNSDGTIVGEYAKYNEISVRRTASRDGQSQYFLNGSRCRRRDITDLFLGTGLGARSYSIIEQGMISEIISAHPDELRGHLEEAAGISKYKERRRETESRIKATRENLERLNDVREEVDKQLEHLNRQAKAAARWQALKAEHARGEAELRGLHYRDVAAELAQHNAGMEQAQTGIEALVAEQRQIEAQIETHRGRHQAAGEHLNTVQAEVYRIGGEIARVEQQIQHNRELAERLQRARTENEQALAELGEQMAADRTQIDALHEALADGVPQLAQVDQVAEKTAETMRNAEAQLAHWQTQWDEYAKASAEASQAAEVERTRLDYLDKQALECARRLEALRAEKAAANVDALSAQSLQLTSEHDAHRERIQVHTRLLDERRAAHDALLESERAKAAALNESRTQLQKLRGRLASLEALQHAALGQEKSTAGEWLSAQGLEKSRRLGEVLDVDAGWETAVEIVLPGLLEGVLTDDPHAFATQLASLRDANIALIDTRSGVGAAPGTLAAHVRGPQMVLDWLSSVRAVESIDDAVRMAATLAAHESVITRAGEWLGRGFARVARGGGAQAGTLAREREIQTLKQQIQQTQQHVDELGAAIEALKSEKIAAQGARDDAQRELYTTHRRVAELAGQLQSHQGKIESARTRLLRIDQEVDELEARGRDEQTQTREARARLEQAVTRMGDLEQRRQHLDSERRQLLEAREEARMNAREAADQAHRLALGLESKRSGVASLEQALARMQTQLGQLQARKTEIAEQIQSGQTPQAALESERQTYLNQRLLIDKQLVDARKGVEERDTEFRGLETGRQRLEHLLGEQREAHAQRRLTQQSLQMRLQQLSEAITGAGHDLDAVLQTLTDDTGPVQWQERLAGIEAKIVRLEPVNLAAISEHEEQSQRKSYLDAQLTDLNTALETLESAIRKIDQETRQRFKDTFDRVNAGLQDLFPRLFGGGHAYLELTGENLLDSGVSIMARPPGKRVSNITLLSGGEKALAAVALVFSIFRLNPAPFCLLDEVDAPLDEANVGRFSQLVAEMSEQVQFLFVTHNKATMEAARQLCGVTMREPGVSRLVQVDLAEAAKLAGAA